MSPLKRDKSLQPLSREHHYSLLLCWKIRMGLKKDIDAKRIKKYVDWFYENSLKQHFEIEEKMIFPVLGTDNEWVAKAVKEHIKLRELFNTNENLETSLTLIASLLEEHVRFEERILFAEIEKVALMKGINLVIEPHSQLLREDNWEDEFWLM